MSNHIPKKVKIMFVSLAVFMPIFLIIPFLTWKNNPVKITTESQLVMQEERLAPVGKVKLARSASNADEPKAEIAFVPADVYSSVCSACHNTGLLDAPKKGDASAWNARIEQRGGVEALIKQGINGLNAMPAKGGAPVDDAQFGEVVRYILQESGIN